jgi:nucleotide-binding universal stress UspA family protein
MKDMQTVIVGYDGSDDGRRAVEAAAEVVADDGVVHVLVAYKAASAGQTERMLTQMPEEFRQTFDAIAAPEGTLKDAECLLGVRGVAHAGHLIDAHPAEAILDTADEIDADLIVVGSRGLGRAARFIRGSVSTRVVNNATASVLVVHSGHD